MFSSTIAKPAVRDDGQTVCLLDQSYLESLVDRWASETFKAGTYSEAGHVHLFGLTEQAKRLDDVSKVVGLAPAKLADVQQRRYEVTSTIIATMRALRDGRRLNEIVGGC